jgi:hypothetical protein
MKWKFISTAALFVLQKLVYAQQQVVNNSIHAINSAIEQEIDAIASFKAPILRAEAGQNVKTNSLLCLLILIMQFTFF